MNLNGLILICWWWGITWDHYWCWWYTFFLYLFVSNSLCWCISPVLAGSIVRGKTTYSAIWGCAHPYETISRGMGIQNYQLSQNYVALFYPAAKTNRTSRVNDPMMAELPSKWPHDGLVSSKLGRGVDSAQCSCRSLAHWLHTTRERTGLEKSTCWKWCHPHFGSICYKPWFHLGSIFILKASI